MKIKSDFVTNSSSSSFIVVWPIFISNLEDVSKYIYRNDFSKIIFKDALKQSPKKISNRCIKEMIEELKKGTVSQIIDYFDFIEKFCKREGISEDDLYKNRQWYNTCLKEYEIRHLEQLMVLTKDFIKK